MSTNGYEIRLELLKMSKEMLEQEWHANHSMTQTKWEHEVELAKIKAKGRDSLLIDIPTLPEFRAFPTEAEVIAKAKTLNEFINQRV
jgi:hypothetical protein